MGEIDPNEVIHIPGIHMETEQGTAAKEAAGSMAATGDAAETVEPDADGKEKASAAVQKAPAASEELVRDTGKEVLDQLAALETLVNASMKQLQQSFDDKIAHTAYEEKIVDRMHDELQDYKQDLYLKIMKPLINEIIGIRDNILQNVKYFQGQGDGTTVPISSYVTYAEQMQDVLENCNVEVFRDEAGDKFDPKCMRVMKKVKTDKQEQHGIIAEVITDGYRYESRLLSPEKVAVYMFDAGVAPKAQA